MYLDAREPAVILPERCTPLVLEVGVLRTLDLGSAVEGVALPLEIEGIVRLVVDGVVVLPKAYEDDGVRVVE